MKTSSLLNGCLVALMLLGSSAQALGFNGGFNGSYGGGGSYVPGGFDIKSFTPSSNAPQTPSSSDSGGCISPAVVPKEGEAGYPNRCLCPAPNRKDGYTVNKGDQTCKAKNYTCWNSKNSWFNLAYKMVADRNACQKEVCDALYATVKDLNNIPGYEAGACSCPNGNQNPSDLKCVGGGGPQTGDSCTTGPKTVSCKIGDYTGKEIDVVTNCNPSHKETIVSKGTCNLDACRIAGQTHGTDGTCACGAGMEVTTNSGGVQECANQCPADQERSGGICKCKNGVLGSDNKCRTPEPPPPPSPAPTCAGSATLYYRASGLTIGGSPKRSFYSCGVETKTLDSNGKAKWDYKALDGWMVSALVSSVDPLDMGAADARCSNDCQKAADEMTKKPTNNGLPVCSATCQPFPGQARR